MRAAGSERHARRFAGLLGRGADRLFGALFAALGAGLLWQAARAG